MTRASLPPVALALLNWNAWKITIECFESLALLKYPDADCYLCDNASNDGSIERIADWARNRGWSTRIVDDPFDPVAEKSRGRESARLTILRSTTNRGFAGGTNLAIRHSLASSKPYRYIWALNTDTTVEPNALDILVRAMEAHPQIASAQSLLVSATNRELLDSAGMRLLRRGGSVDMLQGEPRSRVHRLSGDRDVVPVFGSCAAAALYRVDSLRRFGLFDEALFVGWEDVDLACRLQQNGQGAILATRSIVFHIGGISRTRKKKGAVGWRTHRNKAWIVARWYPRSVAIPILLVGIPRALFAALRTSEVSLSQWTEMTRTVLRELLGGAPGAVRRRIFRLGTAGVRLDR